MSVVRRSEGRSAVAASAYRSASRMTDIRTGLVADYTSKRFVTPLPLILPGGAPPVSREAFWNAVEDHCRRKDAVVAREIDAALPRGLSRAQESVLAERFGRWLGDTYGVAVDVGVHRKPGNHHLDVLISSNAVQPDGRIGGKVRELDAVARQRDKQMPNPTETIRAKWAELVNQALAEAGRKERLDHRSYARQGLGLKPTFHLGRAVHAMEIKNPGSTEVGKRLAEIRAENEHIQQEEPKHEQRPPRKPRKPRTERQPRSRRPRSERQPRPERRPRHPGLPVEAYLPGAPAPLGSFAVRVPGPLEPRKAGRDSSHGTHPAAVVGGSGDARPVRADQAPTRGTPEPRRATARAGLGCAKPGDPGIARPGSPQSRGKAAAAPGGRDPRQRLGGLPPEPPSGGVGPGGPGGGLANPGPAAALPGAGSCTNPRSTNRAESRPVASVDMPRVGTGGTAAGALGTRPDGGRVSRGAPRSERAPACTDDGGRRAVAGDTRHDIDHPGAAPPRGAVDRRDCARELAELDEALRLEVASQNWESEHTLVVAVRPRPQDTNISAPGVRKPGK